MIEVETLFRDLWPALLRWGDETLALARTLHPGFWVALGAPVLLALLFRSVTAALLTLLLAAMALFVFRLGTDDLFRWTFTGLTDLAGLLAVLLAAFLQRRKRQLRQAEWRVGEIRQELDEVNRKYEGEVHWRRAAERVAAHETR
ncbi:hypothetical protein DES45_106255 [Microvirga subterranea]|uniref:Uncharacterized protein n=2 Tax=Microvirga subterranea TaxID=186651 RepID=A0A370HIC1_9HYPH|nr:hypothetical protein DES45_106255 [Microvirga subterranea]